MSPQQVPAGNSPSEIYEYVHIDDFSPGIYSGSAIADEFPTVAAPLGACMVTADGQALGTSGSLTYGCIALPGGGLGPLPGVTHTEDFTDFPAFVGQYFQCGFICNPGLNSFGGDEIISVMEADDGSTSHYAQAWSVVPGNGYAANIILNSTSPSVSGFFGSPFPTFTRMSTSGNSPWPPVLVFPMAVSTDANGANGHLYVYPELLSPGTFAVQDLIVGGSSVTGQVICYGSRVIVLAGKSYTWPVSGGINTNENINFTDPPLSSTYGNQQSILGAEIPWGYGAWGSVSVGELLLVKKTGGAEIVYGDIDAPSSVIQVPGVQSTGDFVGQAAATPAGLVYCSDNAGAWLWNGGNTAQKISHQLDDEFFQAQTRVPGTNNAGFSCYYWRDWVLVSSNYLYDLRSNSWWLLYPYGSQGVGITGDNLGWYSRGAAGNVLYAAPMRIFLGGTQTWFLTFDAEVPTQEWLWTSAPIHVDKDADRVIDVRQVTLRLSSFDYTTTCAVKLSVSGTEYDPIEVPTIGSNPTPVRFNVAAKGLDSIVIQVYGYNRAGAGNSAPMLHSIDIGYQVRAKVAVTN